MKCLLSLAVPLALSALVSAPAVAAKPSSTNKAKLGTTQASGQNAQLGTTYTLGKVNPINVTLDKVEYTTEPVLFGEIDRWPRKGEKFLVLHYTLHNPNPRDFGLSWHTLEILAVDANDKNWRFLQNVAVEGTHELANMSLKRAQKTHLYTAIPVPAQGEIPKLILQSSDKLVLRYDLRGKVTPLPATLADPADKFGATVLETVPAQLGVYYPMLGLHAKIDSASFSTAPVKGRAPKKGGRYLVVLGAAKNTVPRKCRFVWSTFGAKLLDTDGGTLRWTSDVLFPSRDDSIMTELEQGQEVRFRYIFEVPSGAQPKTLYLAQSGDGRSYAFDLSQVQ